MAFVTVFKRYEVKFLITREQQKRILLAMEPYMKADAYGRTTIRNLYFDTERYLLIRRSIEKPIYKEKLRVRSYRRATPDSTVFVELKKKYNHVVYKRRIALSQREAEIWLDGGTPPKETQITKEIDYFLRYYAPLRPTVFLSYERVAFYARDGSPFRVTFDENVLCRTDNLSLCEEVGGRSLLPEDKVLMELKCPGGIPLWMTEILSREKIYKTSFSKYGTAYRDLIFKNKAEVKSNA